MTKETEITPALLHEILHYDSESGLLFWKRRPREMFSSDRICNSWNSRFTDKEAFTFVSLGYRRGAIFGRPYPAHRVVWAMEYGEWPDGNIDHIDHDRQNNKINNLRVVTKQENSKNQSLRNTNKSGVNGVSWYKRDSKWQAFIEVDGKSKCLGRFVNIEDAIAARANADRVHGFHANHGSAK